MNIHEHQAKELLNLFGAPVPKGVVIYNLNEITKKIEKTNLKKFIIKAQIHAGGRGKAGGIKLAHDKNDLLKKAKEIFGKVLITHQTGPDGRKVKRLYIEEASEINKELYLSCLIDRSSSKIAFISCDQGGVDIEQLAKKNPEKINTIKFDLDNKISSENIKKIIQVYNLNDKQKKQAEKLVHSIYKLLIEKDANLIEINPLIINDNDDLCCLDAKISFDDNALYKHPDILALRDLNEEDPAETDASKHGLSYIKLNGTIGCMVNGAGLAMATMDIIKLFGSEPANFLDVGGGASKEKVSAAFKIILSDKNVKGILINIFGGIMRCDVIANGVVEAVKEVNLSIPIVVRLAGTNFELGKKILENSKLKIISANNLSEAAKKILEATR